MRKKEMTRRADAVVNVFVDLGRKNDPRVDGYMEEIGIEYNFSAGYAKALEMAKRQGDTDILNSLKKYTQKNNL